MFLPSIERDDRPLRVLFLDLNAYFASVEQQENPDLRGKPVVVAPMDSDSTCAIAASYAAKAYGIKTGTNIGEAKAKCPDLIVRPATPALYVAYHKRVIESVESVLPVDKVCSIDEMQCRLMGDEKHPDRARTLAETIKRRLREGVGECLTASIGIAPNGFLAKLATDMQKPDGLVLLTPDVIESRTRDLALTDFCGINRRMKARLNAAGIFSAPDLYAADRTALRAAFGSVVGEKWWYLLRGYELEEEDRPTKSLSHSHVLPPNLRHDQGCHDVLMRLLQKATARMRAQGWVAKVLSVSVRGFDLSWKDHCRIDATNDSLTWNAEFERLWANRRFQRPRTVGVCFTELAPAGAVTPSLFAAEPRRDALNEAVDSLNQKFGKNSIYLAALQDVKDTASEKIAFQKTELFQEGKGDNEWPNTFRGLIDRS